MLRGVRCCCCHQVTFVSLFLGPMVLFDNCTRMAVEVIRDTPKPTVEGGGIRAFHVEVRGDEQAPRPRIVCPPSQLSLTCSPLPPA